MDRYWTSNIFLQSIGSSSPKSVVGSI